MNEQTLLEYEPLKFLIEHTNEELTMLNAKMLYAPIANYKPIGTRSEYKDKLTERIEMRDALQKVLNDLLDDFREVKQAYENAIAVLEPIERNYCYNHYVLGMSNKQFSKNFKCPLEKVYKVRRDLLQKIKDL